MNQKLEHRFEYLLQEWVNQNSHTKNFVGVKSVLVQIEEELRALGLNTEWHSAPHAPDRLDLPPALLGVLPATAENASGKTPTFTLVSHADTVFPVDSEFQSITWSEDRKRAVGPGVIDDKGSILVGLMALERLAHLEERKFNVLFLCMPGEEVGSPGFAPFFEKISLRSDYVIGLEPSLPDGSVISSRRGNRWYEISMSGPGGHAGRDAGKVINPLEALIKKIAAMTEAVKGKIGVSLSPGALLTDTEEFNVIPALATAKLDVRFETNVLRDELHALIEPHLAGTEWKLIEDCPSMSLEPKAEAFHKAALILIEKQEKRPCKIQMGSGSSDSNYLSRPGLIMIDGMGATGSGLHSLTETLEVNSILTRSKVVADLISAGSLNY